MKYIEQIQVALGLPSGRVEFSEMRFGEWIGVIAKYPRGQQVTARTEFSDGWTERLTSLVIAERERAE